MEQKVAKIQRRALNVLQEPWRRLLIEITGKLQPVLTNKGVQAKYFAFTLIWIVQTVLCILVCKCFSRLLQLFPIFLTKYKEIMDGSRLLCNTVHCTTVMVTNSNDQKRTADAFFYSNNFHVVNQTHSCFNNTYLEPFNCLSNIHLLWQNNNI